MLDGVCEPCELGFYQDELGQTSCKPCPLGQTTHLTGTSSLTGCTGRGLFDVWLWGKHLLLQVYIPM